MAKSDQAGVYALKTENGKQIFLMGHAEYDRDTLKKEYVRDCKVNPDTKVPENYFPQDNPDLEPINTWRSSANLLYSNWLNYFVYQVTPYDISQIC